MMMHKVCLYTYMFMLIVSCNMMILAVHNVNKWKPVHIDIKTLERYDNLKERNQKALANVLESLMNLEQATYNYALAKDAYNSVYAKNKTKFLKYVARVGSAEVLQFFYQYLTQAVLSTLIPNYEVVSALHEEADSVINLLEQGEVAGADISEKISSMYEDVVGQYERLFASFKDKIKDWEVRLEEGRQQAILSIGLLRIIKVGLDKNQKEKLSDMVKTILNNFVKNLRDPELAGLIHNDKLVAELVQISEVFNDAMK